MNTAIQNLVQAAQKVREEIARQRAFNTGLALGLKLNEESDLYHRYKYLDVIPDRLNQAAKLIELAVTQLDVATSPESKGQ